MCSHQSPACGIFKTPPLPRHHKFIRCAFYISTFRLYHSQKLKASAVPQVLTTSGCYDLPVQIIKQELGDNCYPPDKVLWKVNFLKKTLLAKRLFCWQIGRMLSAEVGKVSLQDVQLVQNLIERCLQLHMSRKEVINALLRAKIEPAFTELDSNNASSAKGLQKPWLTLQLPQCRLALCSYKVWQQLEEENQDFFKAYHLRLIMKDQILKFNYLLQRQIELRQQICATEISSTFLSNGPQALPIDQSLLACYTTRQSDVALKPQNAHLSINSSLPDSYNNGGSSIYTCLENAVEMSVDANRIDVPQNWLLAQSSNNGMIERIEGQGPMIKTEAGYAGCSSLVFDAGGNILETHPAVSDAFISTLNEVESALQTRNETTLDLDVESGILSEITQDVAAGFPRSLDIMENYSMSPFLASDAYNIQGTHDIRERELQGDFKKEDTISGRTNYEDFASSGANF